MTRFLSLFLLFLPYFGFAQFAPDGPDTRGLWQNADESVVKQQKGRRIIVPRAFRTLELDVTAMRAALSPAPMENSTEAAQQLTVLELPMPDGTFERFDIYASPIMEAPLAEQFPEIKTYGGTGIDDPTASVRLDLTPQGFHAMIISGRHSTVFIDPFYHLQTRYYLSYYKKNYIAPPNKMFACAAAQDMAMDPHTHGPTPDEGHGLRFGDCNRRTYRLALACTGEYAQFHGGTVALALAAMNTTMNRVNGVYEREVAVRMNIIANNNLLIYTNANTDPYANNNGGTMLGQNQTTVDGAIGAANYDIGHVFSTGGGGIAGLGVVCTNGQKAQGVTGSGAPIGDPFDIDYVAHEMGHQFGANHTFRSATGACNGNGNNATAYEPGSGSTIMAYAGICAPQDVQNNSDDYFHYASLNEITNYIVTGGGNACDQLTNLTNNPPVITNGALTFTVPINTPFFLTAQANDPDGNALTYCWEQYNNQNNTQPPVGTNTVGPNFRSFDPVASPTRYFPRLQALAAGGPFTWEVLPTVARTMNFRVTVRDNAAGGGCTDEANATVTFNAAAGPFTVTAPNATGINWPALSQQTVTWNVANTDAAPVSCPNVDILLSTDGGLTFPIVLATGVPNNGTYLVNVPNNLTTTARVMVVCSSNIFFDISNNNFTISAPLNGYTLTTTPATQTSCGQNSLTYTVNVNSLGGFNGPVTLSVTGVPGGATATLGQTVVNAGGTTTLTVSGLNGVAVGSYTLVINGTAPAAGNQTVNVGLVVAAGAPAQVVLAAPANAATGVSLTPTLSWTAVPGATTYEVQVSTSATFVPLIVNQTGVVGTTFNVTPSLTANTQYFWRVRAVNGCGNGAYATVRDFTTLAITCTTIASTNVPLVISPTGTPTINSTLVFPTAGTITDVNVTNLVGTHDWISDLRFTLRSPAVTNVVLMDPVCNDENNFNLRFDDQAVNTYATIPCPPVGGGLYQPFAPLAGFNGQDPQGTWTLVVQDLFNQDGGSLTAWSIEVCFEPAAGACLLTASAASTASGCAPCSGVVTTTLTGGTAPFTYAWSNGATTNNLANLCPGTYTVTVTDAAACTATASATVGLTGNITTSASSTGPYCVGATAQFNATGTGTFAWTGPGGFASALPNPSIAGLTLANAGVYRVTLTSAAGCTASASTILVVNAPPTATATNTGAFCVGSTVQLNATGGGTYAWSGPGGFTSAVQNPTRANATLAMAGTYTVTVTTNGCSATASTSVSIINGLVVTASNTGPYCAGSAIELSATSNPAAVTYAWAGPNGYASNLQNPILANATAGMAGTYTVTASGTGGCSGTATTTVVVNSVPTLQLTPTAASCFGENDGAISVQATGAIAYQWNNGANTQNLNGLAAGTYTLTATSILGCTATATATVGQPAAALTVTATGTPSQGNDGTATATATGGTAPLSYLWSNGTTSASLQQLVPGTFTVTVTDANGCTASATAIVDNIIGLTSLPGMSTFDLLPNPSDGHFNVVLVFDRVQDVVLDLYGYNGQLLQRSVHQGQSLQIPMDLTGETNGIFFVLVRTADGYVAKRAAVQF